MKKGFTIVELLIVILIVGIFMGLAVPVFMSIGSESLRSFVNSFASTLRSYREAAIVKNLDCTIVFNPAANTYTVQYAGEAQPRQFEIGRPPGVASNVGLATPECGGGPPEPDGVQFLGNTLVFSAKGSATPGAIYFTNNEETYAIGITITGRIKVWKWGGGRWY